MRADNFQNTLADITDTTLQDEDLDVTGAFSPSGGGQTPLTDNELTAPVSGPSSSQAPVPSAAAPALPDSVEAEPDAKSMSYAALNSDPMFNALVRTGTAEDQFDWLDIQAGEKKPEDLPEYSPIRAALLSAEKINGAKVLNAQKEAERLGLPVGVVMASPETAHRELMAREIEKNVLFAKWASKSRENAAVARDDPAGLGAIFSGLKDFVTHPEEWGRSALHWLTQSSNSPVAQGYREIDRTEQALIHDITNVGESFWGGLQMLADHPVFGGPDSSFATSLRNLRKSSEVMEMPKRLQDVSNFASRADQFWLDAVSAIPGMAAAMMATVGGTAVGGPGVGALAGTAVMGHQIAGGDYIDYTEKQGISRERARTAAIFNAAMQAPLESFGQLLFLKAFSSKGYKQLLENWMKAGGGEAIEEYAQKWPEFMANVYAESEKHGATAAEQDAWSWSQLTDTGRLLQTHQEAMYEALIGGFLGMLGGSVHLSIEGAKLSRAREFADAHKKFHDVMVGDKTAVEAPALVSDILREHNAAMNDSVHVSAEELYQIGQSDVSLFERLGMSEEQVKQDAADGQIYDIPVADLHAYLNDKKQFDAIMDIVREDGDAYSAKEGTDKGFAKEILNETAEEVKGRYQKSVELFQSKVKEEGNIQNELTRLHQEVTQAVLNVPSLRADAKQNGGVGQYVNKIMSLIEQRARQQAEDTKGIKSASGSLRGLHITGENIVRNIGDTYSPKNYVSPTGQTVTQMIESEFAENHAHRVFTEANSSDFFENMEFAGPVQDFATASEVFSGPTWRNADIAPKQKKPRKKPSKGKSKASKPVRYSTISGSPLAEVHRIALAGGAVPLLEDGTVLRLPNGKVTTAFKYDPALRGEGQSEDVARAHQVYWWMRQCASQIGPEADAEFEANPGITTLERLLENGPSMTDVPYEPEKERAKADMKTEGMTAEGHVAGREGYLHTREGDDPVRYELWELDDLNISHDATNGFEPNPNYPKGVQDRPYHKDEAEKNKVRVHASGLKPDMIITDNPDMVNGPSIVSLDGDVLGGNSRAMTMQLVYEKYPENADKYLKMLMDKAPSFGFTSEDVAKFKHPVLVRVVQQQLTDEEKAHKATLYNETPTQELSKVAEGTARGKLLTERSIAILVNRLTEDEYRTLRDFLRHSNAKPFVDSLIKDGVIKDTETTKYLENDGSLTVRGQDLVEDALCGYVVPNTDVVTNLRNRSRRDYNRLLRVLPYMAITKKKGGDWDISNQLTDALRLLSKQGSLEENLGTNSLISTEKPVSLSVETLARLLRGQYKEAEMNAHFATFAKLAMQKVNPLMGVNGNLTAAKAFEEAFKGNIAIVDGQPVLHFDPTTAKGFAYQYVMDNGGIGHRVSQALQALEEELENKDISDERREILKETQGVLAQIKGRVDIYGPVETLPRGLRELLQTAGQIYGSTQILGDNTYVITLFQGANLSSLLHETAHVWFEEMERVSQMEDCPEQLKADFAKLRAWVGADENVPLDVEQKEQLARGMEAYFREGKAPSEELTGIFARFKQWLMQVYQFALQLHVQLTDEVREVFDRMFATEQEIREVYRQNEIATRTEEIADALKLTGADRKAYLGAAQGVADAAAHNIDRVRNANARMRRKQYEAEAHTLADNDKLYPLVDALKDAPLDLEDIKANFGQDMVNKLRAKNSGWVKKDSTVVAEELASEHGYDSAEEMLNDLVTRGKSKRKAISDYVRDKVAEYDAQHTVEDAIEDNEQIIHHLEMEGQYVAKHVGQENVTRHDIRVAAVQRLMGERMFYALRPEKYRAAYTRAVKAERRAIIKGDFDTALTFNYQARFNFEMAAMSRNLVRNLRSTQKTVRTFVGNRKYDPRARFGVMALASQHGMMPWQERLADGKDVASFESWQTEAERDGYFVGVIFDEAWEGESEPRFENRVEYITVGDYSLLANQLNNIIKTERNRHKELRQAKIVDVNELSQVLADTIHANRETKKVKTFESDPFLKRRFKDMHSNHSKIEVLCEALDGRPLGPVWQAIYAPINEAEDNQTRRLRKMKQDMDRLFSVYTEKEKYRLMTVKQMEDAIGESITMQQRLMVALNMGNEGNLTRLRNGHNLTDEQIAAIVKPLTERDWRFVESVWEYMDTFREEAFQLEEDVSGLKPERVKAQPFTVTTSDGKTLNIKGGYFPIRYNNEKEAPMSFTEVKLNEVLFDGLGYASIQTRHDALKDRTKKGKEGVPLMLSFNVIADHAFNMIHDICYRKAILDVAKIVQNETFRDAFATTDGMHLYKLFMPWLQDCAREKITKQTWFDPLARWGRSATTMMMMGLKFTTIFTQPVGLTQSAHVLGGWKYLYRGLRGMLTVNPYRIAEYYQEACARSPFMEARMMNYDRDVRDMLKQINAGVGLQKVLNKAKSFAFTPMGWCQMFCVDLPTWHAAYEKGIKDYAGDEKKAVAYADHVVRTSQGSGATKDLAAIQRGGESLRLVTMFYSYFNTLYNVAALHADWARKHHTPADMWLTFCAAMNLWFLPAIASELVAGRGPGDDDDPWWWALKQELNYPLQTIVLFRELGNALLGEYDYQISPAEMAPKSIANWMKAVKKKVEGNGSTEAVVKKSAEMGGYLLGLPLKQVIINTDNFYKWMIDEADFRFRDLFFVKRKNESQRGR